VPIGAEPTMVLPATLDEHGGDVIGEDGFLVIVS
jgi:hypothetical protein